MPSVDRRAPRDVHLYICPIESIQKLSEELDVHVDIPFVFTSHWAVVLNKYRVYEVKRKRDPSKDSRHFEIGILNLPQWQAANPHLVKPPIKLGKTVLSTERLDELGMYHRETGIWFSAHMVWDVFNNGHYNVLRNNCQCFAEIFSALILAGTTDPLSGDVADGISDAERRTWEKFPRKLLEMNIGGKGGLIGISPATMQFLQHLRDEAASRGYRDRDGTVRRLDRIQDIRPVLQAAYDAFDKEDQKQISRAVGMAGGALARAAASGACRVM